mmetsp:Transcript_41765/g.65225  ORF Transcript_41765/g.65225 Transcript_41765/m.65225 type:complete len:244 (-) Transcript_41765:258-989(-)
MTNKCISLRQPSCSKSKASGHDCRKSLGNGCNSQHNCDLEEVHCALGISGRGQLCVTSQRKPLLAKLGDVDTPAGHTHHHNDVGEHVTELVKLFLEWRIAIFCLRQGFGDLSDLRSGPGFHNHASAFTVHKISGRKQNVLFGRELIVDIFAEVFMVFVYTCSFSGQGCLFCLEGGGHHLSNANIGWHFVTNCHLNNVSWHQLLGIDHLDPAFPENLGLVWVIRRQSFNCCLSIALLPHPDARI